MKLKDYLTKFKLTKMRLNLLFVNSEISFQEADKDAAWEL